VEKHDEAFRTIGEVAEQLGVAAHVLRFWETRFPELKPMQRGGGRRYYRPPDVALAAGLKRLLHDEGYTVKGVRALLDRGGVAAVTGERAEASPAPPAGPMAALRVVRDRLAALL
jgi:DNA-binding transcriptional MerR regulator